MGNLSNSTEMAVLCGNLGERAMRERFLKGARGLEKSGRPPSAISYWGNLTDDKSLKMAPNGPKLHRTDKYTLNNR